MRKMASRMRRKIIQSIGMDVSLLRGVDLEWPLGGPALPLGRAAAQGPIHEHRADALYQNRLLWRQELSDVEVNK